MALRQPAEAGILLVLIGREWIKMTDKSGVPRLDNPADFVRLEILAGLEQKTVIIPVLLADAEMPSAQALPAPLQPFEHGIRRVVIAYCLEPQEAATTK